MSDREEELELDYSEEGEANSGSDSRDEPSRSPSRSRTRRRRSRSRSRSRTRRRRSRKPRSRRSRRSSSGSPDRVDGQQGEDPQDGGTQPQTAPATATQAGDQPEARVLLCSVHKNNLLPDQCNACRCCSRLVGADMARQLAMHGGLPSTSAIPGPAQRLCDKQSDEIDPTLVLSSEEMETAKRMFSMGKFRKGHWEEVVRDHLLTPKPQHTELSQDLVLEQSLRVVGHDGKFQALNDYRDKLIKLGLDLRVAQRPFVLSVGVNTDLARYVR